MVSSMTAKLATSEGFSCWFRRVSILDKMSWWWRSVSFHYFFCFSFSFYNSAHNSGLNLGFGFSALDLASHGTSHHQIRGRGGVDSIPRFNLGMSSFILFLMLATSPCHSQWSQALYAQRDCLQIVAVQPTVNILNPQIPNSNRRKKKSPPTWKDGTSR